MRLLNKKYVRIILWALAAVITVLFILLVVADIYIHNHKDQLTDKIKTILSTSINGEVTIKNVDASVFASFPYAGINVYGVSVLDSQYHQPMLRAGYASCRISLLQLLSPDPEIAKLVIRNGTFHFFTDSTGYTNAYLLLKKDKTKKQPAKELIIHRLEFQNVSALIEDVTKDKRYDFTFREMDASIDKHDSTYTIKMEEQAFVRGLAFNGKRGAYLDSQTVNGKKWILYYDLRNHLLSFPKTSISVDNFRYTLDGSFHFKDSAWFKLHVMTSGIPYKKLVTVLTKNIQRRIGTLGIEGTIDAEATLQGRLEYLAQPLVNVRCSTTNNEIITPIASFTDCSFNGSFTNHAVDSLPVSDENSLVLINNFKGNWGEIELNADSIRLTDIIRPNISFNFLSKCNFQTLNDQLSFESIDFTGGTAELYLQYNGPISASPAFLSKVTADVRLENASLIYYPRDLTFTNCTGNISVSANNITIDSLRCDVRGNHFFITMAGNNMTGLTNENLAKADIVCNVFSPSVDLDDFQSMFSPRKHKNVQRSKSKMAAIADKVDDILNKGNLEMNVKANHIRKKTFTADNVMAQVVFFGDDWQVQRATLSHAGGTLSVTGAMHQVNDNYHQASSKVVARDVDVRRLFYAFNNFGLTDLSYRNLHGIMNANADITFGTNSNGHIVPGSLNGVVDFSIKNGSLVNFTPVQKLEGIAFLHRDLSNISFAELKDKITIKGTEIEIPRMEIASSAITMYVQGIYGLNNNTDISIQVPWSNLAQKDSTYKPVNKGVAARVGPSIWLRAKSDESGKVKIKLELFKKRKKDTDSTEGK